MITIPAYIIQGVGGAVWRWVRPDRTHCWLRGKVHNWGAHPDEPDSWASKQCEDCGREAHGCGM